jgi:acetylornithine deacetylase
LLIDVHQDTVGTAGMTIDPFEPLQRNGRIYGRGSCDVKGSLAVVLAVLSRLVRNRPAEMPTLIVACTINEENGFTGVKRLAESWTHGRSQLVARRPDAAIVAEPTQLNVVVSHKGTLRWRCHTRGVAAHSSRPETGENAIYKMARVVRALESYAEGLASNRPEHPLLGHPTLSLGTISGGAGVNTVPDHCQIELDRRLLPDEDPMAVFREIERYLAESTAAGDAPEHDEPYLMARGLSAERNGPLANQLQQTVCEAGIACEQMAVPFGTDAGAISETGVPAVVFGPGSVTQAHTVDEWIAIEQLHRAEEILYEFCSREPPR